VDGGRIKFGFSFFKITVKNLQILVVDKEQSVIGIKGAIPGNAGGDVIVKIAKI